MKLKKSIVRLLVPAMIVWLGCVDPASLSISTKELPIIIQGMVTDQEGADTIKITVGYPVDGSYYPRVGVAGARMIVTDDAGNRDVLTDIGLGYYVTDSIEGKLGRTYTLRGKLRDGTEFISTPETLNPSGSIDSIYFKFVSGKNVSTGMDEDGFNVYVNSTAAPQSSLRLRWRFRGTYKVVTDPSLIVQVPLPCAQGCECCICYAKEYDNSPILSDTRVTGTGIISGTFVHYIPINGFTFTERYRVDVEQMEISKPVYDFYFAVKSQFQNATSLFQPPFFALTGNVETVSGSKKLIGLFSAGAVVSRHIYIYRSDIPYPWSTQPIAGDCRAVVPHSSIDRPSYWN